MLTPKKIPECCNSDASYRFFADPPEDIGRAFGGRRWFFDTECRQLHRIGVFRGLGWVLHPSHEVPGINSVKITHANGKYHIQFGETGTVENDSFFEPVTVFGPLALNELKPKYVEILGETAA